MIKVITFHIDGSCIGNKRNAITPGGYGVICVNDGVVEQFSKHIEDTTSDRAELIAFIKAMKLINERGYNYEKVTIYTDSRYVVDGYTAWLSSWVSNNWRRRNGKPVLNKDLWLQVVKLPKMTELSIKWEKGHAGNKYNEMADKLAQKAARNPTGGTVG